MNHVFLTVIFWTFAVDVVFFASGALGLAFAVHCTESQDAAGTMGKGHRGITHTSTQTRSFVSSSMIMNRDEQG